MAGPPMVPGCHAQSTARDISATFWKVNGRPAIDTAIIGFPVLATSLTKSYWTPGGSRYARDVASAARLASSPGHRSTTAAPVAASTAAGKPVRVRLLDPF